MNNLFRYNLYLYHYLVRVSNTDTIGRVWPVNLLVAPSHSIAIVSSISRPLAIVVDTIAIRSMVVRTALVDKRAGTAIISWLSRPLAIITTIAITSITVSTIACKALCGSVCISSGISWLSISRPLAIIPTIAITSITIASQALGCSIHRAASTIRMIRNSSISRLSLALAITITTITITTITIASQALGRSVDRAAATIGVKSHSSIARLSSCQAGKGGNNCYNLSCHGY